MTQAECSIPRVVAAVGAGNLDVMAALGRGRVARAHLASSAAEASRTPDLVSLPCLLHLTVSKRSSKTELGRQRLVSDSEMEIVGILRQCKYAAYHHGYLNFK